MAESVQSLTQLLYSLQVREDAILIIMTELINECLALWKHQIIILNNSVHVKINPKMMALVGQFWILDFVCFKYFLN